MRTARGGHSASVGTTALSLLRVGLYARVWLLAAVAVAFAGACLVSPPEANADALPRLSPSAYDSALSTCDPTPSTVLGSSETGSRRESPNPEVLTTPDAYVSIPSVGVAANTADEVVGVASNVPKITFGHGARHLEGTGLGVEEVESTILQRVTTAASHATSETESFWGRIEIRGTTIEYRAYTLPDGTINVGTHYVP